MSKGLPRGVVRKRDNYYLRFRILGTETYIPLPKIDDPSFGDALAQARLRHTLTPRPERHRRRWPATHHLSAVAIKADRKRSKGYGAGQSPPSWIVNLAREARKRAARKSLLFDLTIPQLGTLVRRADDRCEVSGLPFVHEPGDFRRRPFAPSLDRIDSGQGYTYSNVRIVCCCVNAALNEWGDDVFWMMVFSAVSAGVGEIGSPKGWGNPQLVSKTD